MNVRPPLLAALLLAASCRAPGPSGDVRSLALPYFQWQDKYAPEKGDKRFFDIPALMERYGLDRLEAVEVQNHYRDELRARWEARGYALATLEPFRTADEAQPFTAAERAAVFARALERVRAGELESGWSAAAAREADLVVVFDLDETLLHRKRGAPGFPLLAPDAEEALRAARRMGAAVVLFTALPDDHAHRILAAWTIDTSEGPVPLGEWVDAVFTNHHLTLQRRNVAAGDPRPRPAPTKDLRLIEPTCEKIVLVDDNPRRVLQLANLRFVTPWEGDPAAAPAGFFASRLLRALDEIREARRWAEVHDTSFAAAFLPYSRAGRETTCDLADAVFDGDEERARAFVRRHPALVDR